MDTVNVDRPAAALIPDDLPAALAGLSKEARAGALREALATGRQRIAEAHRAGRPGDETAREWSRALDASSAARPPRARGSSLITSTRVSSMG